MQKADIKRRKEYAFREKRPPGTPLQRVRVLEHVRGNKWKAEWIDPNPGLIDYVQSSQLIVPWKEQRAFLRDEEREARLREHNVRQGFKRESTMARALEEVFESSGESFQFLHGTLSCEPEVIRRIRARAGLNTEANTPSAYVDRHGTLHLPFDEALELARKFCAAEPSTVLVGAETAEREWDQAARRGENHIITLLNEYRASWAILRQWAGSDAAVAQRDAEIQRLERLVWDAVYALQKAGQDEEAGRLRRALKRN